MEVWFSIQITRKVSLKTTQDPVKLESMGYGPYGILSFQEGLEFYNHPLYGYDME